MIIVILRVNGIVRAQECATEEEAREVANRWLIEARKAFPHKAEAPPAHEDFKAHFYNVIERVE